MRNIDIDKDINEEFDILRKGLQLHLQDNISLKDSKLFLEKHVPREVVHKAQILLETLINYLMKESQEFLDSADIKLQNKFFETDFRKKFGEWANQLENKLQLESDAVQFSTDPRIKEGLIAGGITFIVGTAVTTIAIPTVIGIIVSGFVTVILSAIAFKLAYDHATPKAKELIKSDIDSYIDNAKKQVINWLKSVLVAYTKDFEEFCKSNDFVLEANING